MPFIWNYEWMIFVPEVITKMEYIPPSQIHLPDGPGLGRLELNSEFNERELCDGGYRNIVRFEAYRETWFAKDLVIFYTVDGKEKELRINRVLIDTGSTLSSIHSFFPLDLDSINRSSSIRIQSFYGYGSVELTREENLPFFLNAASGRLSIIGLNILRRLVLGFNVNLNQVGNTSGQIIICLPKSNIPSEKPKREEIDQAQYEMLTKS
jgi:predicted aspartyl protease